MKIRTITFSYPHANPDDSTRTNFRFRVERITDSVEFVPGQYLQKQDVDELCTNNGWKVTSVPVPS